MDVRNLSMEEREALINSIEKDVKQYGACCFTHIDMDGKASAYVLRSKFGKARTYSVNHGRPINLSLIIPRQVVFVLDFSFPVETVRQIQAMGCRVIHCDHHDAINSYPPELNLEGNCRIEPGTSGCSLIYELLYPKMEKLPRVVELIAKYDTWSFEGDDDVLPFSHGFALLDMEYTFTSDQTWMKLCTDAEFLQRVIDAGRHISVYDKTRNDILATEYAFKTDLDGIEAIAINTKNSNSKIFDVLDPENKIPFRVLYAFYSNVKGYRIGIYSADETKYDAAAFARKFNGDGRASTAGCICKKLPFKTPEPKDSFLPDYRDFTEPLMRMMTNDPLMRRHADIQNRQVIRSIHTPIACWGWRCSFLNHGLMTSDGWVLTGLNFSYDIGVTYAMLNNGWYRLVIYPLRDDITLDEIAKRTGGKIVKNSVILYQKNCPMEDLLT